MQAKPVHRRYKQQVVSYLTSQGAVAVAVEFFSVEAATYLPHREIVSPVASYRIVSYRIVPYRGASWGTQCWVCATYAN